MCGNREATNSLVELTLLVYAMWCPPRDVVVSVTAPFRATNKKATYYTFVTGLQQVQVSGANLAAILNLATEVPSNMGEEGLKSMLLAQVSHLKHLTTLINSVA